MKQYKIIAAYNAAEKLSEFEITEKEQWEIYQLRKALRSHYDFQVEREEDLKKRYAKFADSQGNLDEEKANEVMQELNKIGNLDIELSEIRKPKIKLVSGINCKMMETLEDFVEFIPE